jgi:hypothetical protein
MVYRASLIAAFVIRLAGTAGAADPVDFATKVQPIFAARCISCHGPDKQMAKLRLDSDVTISETKKDSLLAPGEPDASDLYKRISLPKEDRKRMPKGGDPLTAEEIAVIRQWIVDGAKLTATAAPATDAVDAPAEDAKATPPSEEDPELQSLPPASTEAIAKIEATGATVMPLFADSPLLQVSFAQAESPPGDEAVAALTAAADQIVWLNLSKAQLSADGLAPLAQLKNLIQLHLERSSIADSSLTHLAGLKRLEYVNLYGTAVTDAALDSLKGLPKLRRLYVWQTAVSYQAAEALRAAIPELEVNLGWDHPQVVKIRVTKEIETAKEIAKTSAARADELEQQLKAAREASEQAGARVKELEDQLKALEAPSDDEKAEGGEKAQGAGEDQST